MKVKNVYTSVGVNQTPSALDWGQNGLLCYGAANSVAVSASDPSLNDACRQIKTLTGHTARVNTVKWIRRSNEPEFELISGSDDSNCIYWNLKDTDRRKKFLLSGHGSGVTSIDAVCIDNEVTIATASADSTVRLWRFNPDEEKRENIDSFQVINLNSGICFNVKLLSLFTGGILLAYATDDDKIHLHGENSSKCFERVETLTGHEDWVRSLDFTTDENGDILLASSSQDSFIRLWRISPKSSETKEDSDEILIQVEERSFKVAEQTFVLSLESVLQGHENWVYSVNWSRNKTDNSLQLLSSSMDKTMIVWSIDKEQELWTEKIRVGNLLGGNSLGFYGAKFHASGKSLIGHGFHGSLHLWKESEVNSKLWSPGVINGGHFKEVRDIGWDPEGKFLFSASIDQTSRIHACWNRSGTFHEIARPQVHGYDMQCLAVLTRYRFASAAEEKIVRTFQAPGNFVENFRALVGVDDDDEGDEILKTHQKGASVPSLGLSNKAVYEEELIDPKSNEKKFKDEYPENYFVPITLKEPPTEEDLTQNTLWPELQKLYAHGYELYSLAATKNGKILASACKATTLEHAEIILWDTESWKILQRLRSHKLTVTQMKFSSDGNRLLSTSRDRRWTLFENVPNEENKVNFQVATLSDRQNKVHERIIWCCGWTHDDEFFATGSRDGKVALWSRNEDSKQYESVAVLEFPKDSITALTFATKELDENSYLLAVGVETGIIHLYKFDKKTFTLLRTLEHSEAHHLCVNKLEFRPNFERIQLASCGNDNTVKIQEIEL